jgi:hypothetical protein
LPFTSRFYRSPPEYLADHPLVLAGPDVSLLEQLDLVDPRLVDDVVALAALLIDSQPGLAGGHHQVVSNPTFDRSSDLGGADADLIVDGTLLELRTVKSAVLSKIAVWQVLGYLLADTGDRHRIRAVGWYFSRQGYLWQLPVEEFLARLHGAPVDLASARVEFAGLLQPPARVPGPSEQTWDSWVSPTIQRTVSFFPSASGRGRWHIARTGRRQRLGRAHLARLRSPGNARPHCPALPDLWSVSHGATTTDCVAAACSTPAPTGASSAIRGEGYLAPDPSTR